VAVVVAEYRQERLLVEQVEQVAVAKAQVKVLHPQQMRQYQERQIPVAVVVVIQHELFPLLEILVMHRVVQVSLLFDTLFNLLLILFTRLLQQNRFLFQQVQQQLIT
jgi:hypothetical protein